jgi:NTP pyrophosphatase (non-canonical NTP hydrolase)
MYSEEILQPSKQLAPLEFYAPILNQMADHVRFLNARWWTDLETGQPLNRNKGELIALMHSELSEQLEGVRKDEMDKHLPHRSSEEVELADLIIRALDYAGGFNLDLAGAVREKLEYNMRRADHTAEARRQANGKKF